MLDFPSSPTVGQKFPAVPTPGLPVFQWDGVKWGPSKTIIGASPSNVAPLMDGVAAPGIAVLWSRGDHVHPTDTKYAPVADPTFTGTFGVQTFNVTGNAAITGTVVANATQKKHQFGNASGQTYGSPLLKSDANIILYNYDNLENWCGMGTDINGHFYVRTGAGERVTAAFACDLTQASFATSPVAPSPANGSNDTQVATTAFVNANQAVGGPYYPTSGGVMNGGLTNTYAHIRSYRAGGTTGVIYFGTDDRYFYYDGSNYVFGTDVLNSAAGRLWGSGDWTRPVYSARVGPHAGDYTRLALEPLAEPYGGAVITGSTDRFATAGAGGYVGCTSRYRYNQILVEGTWYTAGYV